MKKQWFASTEEKTHDIGELDMPRKCLVVDDDDDFVNLMSQFLQLQKYQVVTAKNGVEGLKKIMADDFDVVVCDMVMPHMPGDMFYLAVQRTKPRMCRRFVFVTGHRGNPKIDAFIRQVGGVMLWKPFQINELIGAIRSVVRKAEKAERQEQSK